jgi:hypothetical protein
MRRRLLLACMLGLAGCADYLAVDNQGHTTAEPLQGARPAAPVKGDVCGAAPLQYLVGRNKVEAPPPVDPSRRRVYCSSCVAPGRARPDQVDIVFDKDTGTITAVKCG